MDRYYFSLELYIFFLHQLSFSFLFACCENWIILFENLSFPSLFNIRCMSLSPQLMKHMLRMFIDANVYGRAVYKEDFEDEYLRSTQLFYRHEAQEFLGKNSIPDYLTKALKLRN